jgi:hypothetical protein
VLFDQNKQRQIREAVGTRLDDLGLFWEDSQSDIGFHITLFEFLIHGDPNEEMMERLEALAQALFDELSGSDLLPEEVLGRVRQLESLSNSLFAYVDFLGSDGEPVGWMDSVRQWCEASVDSLRTLNEAFQGGIINILKVPFPLHVTLCRFPRALEPPERKKLQNLISESRRKELTRFPITSVALVVGRKTPYNDTKTVGTVLLRGIE